MGGDPAADAGARLTGNVTEHFTWSEVTRSETARRLGIANTVPAGMVPHVHRTGAVMEQVRALLGAPIDVLSWYRCPALNRAIGGSATSAHMMGLAMDFRAQGLTLEETFERIATSAVEFDQLIIERTKSGAQWIHLGLSLKPPRRELLRADGDKLGGRMFYRRVSVS